MEKENKRLVFSSIDNGYTYKDYCEWCEENGIEPKGESSWDYLEWVGEETNNDYECVLDNIKYSKNNGRCVISGQLGLWWGSPTIEEVVCDSLVAAIKKCNQNDGLEIYECDGYVEVHSIHHDGTNIFEIRPIGNRGKNKDNDEIEESENPLWYCTKYPKYIY